MAEPDRTALAPSLQRVAGLGSIADRYDGFVLDVWGVIHDGVRPYPGVVEALQRLRSAGKKVALLSNAPARAQSVARRIERIGVPRALFGPVISSGEEVWQCLHDRDRPFFAALGSRCLLLGPAERAMVEGLPIALAHRIEEADFILNTGPDVEDDAATSLLPLLTGAARSGVPMVCANADLHVMHGGRRLVCAGQVAAVYERLGGPVSWHGKPHASVYRTCLGRLDAGRVLAIGDSLRTDIAGAAASGLDSLLVLGGIHAEALGWHPGRAIDPGAVAALAGDGPKPNWIAGQLAW